jgi:EpsI family protein
VKSKTLWIILALLAVQAVLYGLANRTERVNPLHPLSEIPVNVGEWKKVADGVTDPETMAILRADEVLNRTYSNDQGWVNLFIAYFATQKAGQAPHSPKNCLPGSGWVQESAETVDIPIAEVNKVVDANQYVVVKGEHRSLVIYWYQSHGRTIASEYRAKFFVVADSIRMNRSDTSLVRVTLPIAERRVDAARAIGERFIQKMFPILMRFLPS